MKSVEIITGDCRAVLPTLAAESVHCCVTSPPYWGLRDYGVDGQIGLEASFSAWLVEMVEVFREVRRVLRKDGTLWVNIGDAYAGSRKGGYPNPTTSTLNGSTTAQDQSRLAAKAMTQSRRRDDAAVPRSDRPVEGLKPKDLIGMPWRLAFALQADGWFLRRDIVWHKPNAMPESVTDRPATAHEYVFLLSKSGDTQFWTHRDKGLDCRVFRKPLPDYRWINKATREEIAEDPGDEENWRRANLWSGMDYYYDADAIVEKCSENTHARIAQDLDRQKGSTRTYGGTRSERPMKTVVRVQPKVAGWSDAPEAHNTIEHNRPGVNPQAGAVNLTSSREGQPKQNPSFASATAGRVLVRNSRSVWSIPTEGFKGAHYATFPRELAGRCIKAGCPAGGLVLDPFGGTATTAEVALKLGRRAVCIELNPEYAAMARKRLADRVPLFSGEVT